MQLSAKRMTTLKIGTWNVRTMSKDDTLKKYVKKEIKRLEINILELRQNRWQREGINTFERLYRIRIIKNVDFMSEISVYLFYIINWHLLLMNFNRE